jgi:hypothetical protein
MRTSPRPRDEEAFKSEFVPADKVSNC